MGQKSETLKWNREICSIALCFKESMFLPVTGVTSI
jgi:hypothetical protein